METDIANQVMQLAAEQAGVDPTQITRETHFVNDLNFDSLDVVEYTMALEDEFEISVPDEEAARLSTVAQVIDYVTQQMASVSAK